MSTAVRMRSLETADGKSLPPLHILDILEGFINDPMLYYPEINIANLKSKGKAKGGHIFSPDIFAKTFTRENFEPAEFHKLMAENDYLSTAVAAFDKEDTERVSATTIKKAPARFPSSSMFLMTSTYRIWKPYWIGSNRHYYVYKVLH